MQHKSSRGTKIFYYTCKMLSLLTCHTVQPESTYSYILKVKGQF